MTDVLSIIEKLEITDGFETHNGEYTVSCPLPFGNHKNGDKNPSFSINLNTGQYNCFVCGGGSLTQLISYMKGISYEEAEYWLRNDYVDESNDDFKQRLLDKLDKRNIKQERTEEGGDVLTLDGYEKRYVQWLEDQNITADTAEKFGIVYNPELPGIIFPHYWQGKLVGWQQRDLNENRKGPKYKNTPNFPKHNTLYNYDFIEGDEVIVVESPKTVCVLDSRGIKNVVATFGASIRDEQLQPLWKFKRVYLWFDNDDAGQKALYRYNEDTGEFRWMNVVERLKDQCEVYIVDPVGVNKGDPADVSKEECLRLLGQAKSYLRFKFEKIHNK